MCCVPCTESIQTIRSRSATPVTDPFVALALASNTLLSFSENAITAHSEARTGLGELLMRAYDANHQRKPQNLNDHKRRNGYSHFEKAPLIQPEDSSSNAARYAFCYTSAHGDAPRRSLAFHIPGSATNEELVWGSHQSRRLRAPGGIDARLP